MHDPVKAPAEQLLRPQPKVKLYAGDRNDALADMDSESVHMALTDPPCFLDGLDGEWKKGNGGRRGTGPVNGLPVGMKSEADQGRRPQGFMEPVAGELMRILKPGAFALVFSAPRLVHRMAVAFEDSGFEIRDLYAWRFTRRAQFRAFPMDHSINKRKGMGATDRRHAIKSMSGRKTPQLRPQFEAVLCARKPRSGTFVDNWLEHGTGLTDSGQTLKGKVPSTVMTVEKDDRERFNGHLTPKPIRICEHLIRLFTKPGQVVIDPFVGSGSTCVAAHKSNRHCIGTDINPHYVQIARHRVEETRR